MPRSLHGSEVSINQRDKKKVTLFRLGILISRGKIAWQSTIHPARPEAASRPPVFAGKPQTRPRRHAKPKDDDFGKVNRVHKRLHGELTRGSRCVASHRLAHHRQLSS